MLVAPPPLQFGRRDLLGMVILLTGNDWETMVKSIFHIFRYLVCQLVNDFLNENAMIFRSYPLFSHLSSAGRIDHG
jgi:hypothetical protein